MDDATADGSAPTRSLCHLVFVSHALQTRTPTNVRKLLADCREANKRDALSGLLIYHHGFFLQCLEGPTAAVDTTFARIRADSRHGDVRPLLRERIARRSFHRWFLAYTEVGAMTWHQILTAPWPGVDAAGAGAGAGAGADPPPATSTGGPAADPDGAGVGTTLVGILLLRRCWDIYRFEASTNAGPPSH